MGKWALFVCLLFGIWFGGWFVFANWADGKLGSALANLERRGIKIDCMERQVIGFPFRAGIHCDQLSVVDDVHDYSLQSGSVRSAAQLYAPRKNIIEVDGPFGFENGSMRIDANWEVLRTYVEVERGGFETFSTNYRQLQGNVDDVNFTVVSGAIHGRQNPGDKTSLDLATTSKEFSLRFDDNVVEFDASFDMIAQRAYQHFVRERKTLTQWVENGAAVDVRSVILAPKGGEGRLFLRGPVKVEADGSLTGEIKVGVEDHDALARWISTVNPEFGPLGAGIGQAMAILGKEETFGRETVRAITVKMNRGNARIGFLDVGQLPPLFDLN